MLYGFSVYQSRQDGGGRITAPGLVNRSCFDGWMQRILPFDDHKFAVTEDGELIVLDTDAGTFDMVPEKRKMIVQYGAGDYEEY